MTGLRKRYGRPSRALKTAYPERSDHHLPEKTLFDRRWLIAVHTKLTADAGIILCGLLVFMFLFLFNRGLQLGLDQGSSGRVSIHAVPVAIAALYHGLPHDYTSRKAFALSFQDTSTTLDEKIEIALKAGVDEKSEKYYWAADDRGMADFVIGAFKLFGPKERSLYQFYFVVLLISLAAYVAAFYRSPVMLALGVFALTGVGAFQSILPLVDEATFMALANADQRAAPVGMFEPRALDVLTILAVLHILLFAWRTRALNAVNVVLLSVQVIVFVLAYHARSSLGWQVLAMLIFGLSSTLWISFKSNNRVAWKQRAFTAALPCVLLIVALAGLNGYKRYAYDPLYFAEMGGRTFWHNALMGLGSSSRLASQYGLGVDDRLIAEAVVKHARLREGENLDPSWDAQKILESLGGYGVFDWKTYEIHARSLYFDIVLSNKRRVIAMYLVKKPLKSLSVVLRTMREHRDPKIAQVQNSKRLFFNPFAWPMAVAGLAAIFLAFAELCKARDIWCALAVIGLASLIPSVAFYSAVLTLGGFFVVTSIAAYLTLPLAIGFVGKRYLAPA